MCAKGHCYLIGNDSFSIKGLNQRTSGYKLKSFFSGVHKCIFVLPMKHEPLGFINSFLAKQFATRAKQFWGKATRPLWRSGVATWKLLNPNSALSYFSPLRWGVKCSTYLCQVTRRKPEIPPASREPIGHRKVADLSSDTNEVAGLSKELSPANTPYSVQPRCILVRLILQSEQKQMFVVAFRFYTKCLQNSTEELDLRI